MAYSTQSYTWQFIVKIYIKKINIITLYRYYKCAVQLCNCIITYYNNQIQNFNNKT